MFAPLNEKVEGWLRSTAIFKVIVYQSSHPVSLTFLLNCGQDAWAKNSTSEKVQL